MAAIDAILARHSADQASLLPILHAVQAEVGYISEESIRQIAKALNLTRAEVYGVVSFYHDFKQAPPARPVLQLCRAEACQARGVDRVLAALPAQDDVAIETVYCLGLCSVGPAAMIAGQPYARLDAARLAELVERLT